MKGEEVLEDVLYKYSIQRKILSQMIEELENEHQSIFTTSENLLFLTDKYERKVLKQRNRRGGIE